VQGNKDTAKIVEEFMKELEEIIIALIVLCCIPALWILVKIVDFVRWIKRRIV